MLSGWFFFSSRRRHTRCSRDWSSDVCSSDLVFFKQLVAKSGPRRIENDADVFRIVVFDQALENISKKKRNVRGRAVSSEEHTSELQSLLHLVCRLLLEKINAVLANTVARLPALPRI